MRLVRSVRFNDTIYCNNITNNEPPKESDGPRGERFHCIYLALLEKWSHMLICISFTLLA